MCVFLQFFDFSLFLYAFILFFSSFSFYFFFSFIISICSFICLSQQTIFPCPFLGCEKVYRGRRKYLEDHFDEHHRGVYYGCTVCDHTLNTRSGMTRHMIVHPEYQAGDAPVIFYRLNPPTTLTLTQYEATFVQTSNVQIPFDQAGSSTAAGGLQIPFDPVATVSSAASFNPAVAGPSRASGPVILSNVLISPPVCKYLNNFYLM